MIFTPREWATWGNTSHRTGSQCWTCGWISGQSWRRGWRAGRGCKRVRGRLNQTIMYQEMPRWIYTLCGFINNMLATLGPKNVEWRRVGGESKVFDGGRCLFLNVFWLQPNCNSTKMKNPKCYCFVCCFVFHFGTVLSRLLIRAWSCKAWSDITQTVVLYWVPSYLMLYKVKWKVQTVG